MTEPVITINGRTLIEPQVTALRGALKAALGVFDVRYDPDRLDEVIGILDAVVVPERAKAEKMLSAMHTQRRDRILQLAGIVPEQASQSQLKLALEYASSNLQPDEAAMRLRRVMMGG